MSRTAHPNTILAHPALAGRTLFTRREDGWAARLIQPEGQLGEAWPVEADPAAAAWRGGPSQ